MKNFISFLFFFLLIIRIGQSQGCIAIRNISGFGQYNLTDKAFSTSNWQLNITNRYFKSFREFKGTTEVKFAKENEIVHHIYTMDVTATRLMRNGWSVTLSVPYVSNKRTTSIDHGGDGYPRHSVHASGIGDVRMMVYKWLKRPRVNQNMNVQLGLGIKLPTGSYASVDYFYRREDSAVLAPVPGAIQPGDGGTGIISELNAYYVFNKTNFQLFGNFYYLMNPKDNTGTSSTMGKTPNATQIQSTQYIISVPDQFAVRVGALQRIKNISISGAIRYEGQPVYDLIGESNGARRAGYNLSFEPGVIYKMKQVSFYAYTPIIIGRKIKQNVPDKRTSEINGKYTISPGGFANYIIFAGIQFRF